MKFFNVVNRKFDFFYIYPKKNESVMKYTYFVLNVGKTGTRIRD